MLQKLFRSVNCDNSNKRWLKDLFLLGLNKDLTQEDLYNTLPEDVSEKLGDIDGEILRLSKTATGHTTTGQVVNLLSNDVSRFDKVLMFLHYVWIMPFQTVLLTYFIWQFVGISALVGVGALFLQTVPVQGYLGKLTSKLRLKVALRTDERVRLMSEIISGIQVIKMYAWEKPFEKMVALARKHEIDVVKQASYLRGVYFSAMVFSERMTLFLTLLAYVLLGNHITPEKVFSLAQFYNIMQLTMAIFYPQAIQFAAEAKVSIKRLEDFLSLEETVAVTERTGNSKLGITISGVSASWEANSITDTLSQINLNVQPGQLCVVIGPVGAGKSSLLQAILKELPLYKGTITASSEVSYASQEPWLFVGTVRQNILFGQPYNPKRYNEVVKVCALKRDFELFANGDKTIVGERGVSLSGGQRARINLARAVYRESDVYLLDDPLSAVDTHVGKHLFEECITSYLSGKARILVTHQLQHIKYADHIVILNNGLIEVQGTYTELTASNIDFAALLNSEPEQENTAKATLQNLSRQTSHLSRQTSHDSTQFEQLLKLDLKAYIILGCHGSSAGSNAGYKTKKLMVHHIPVITASQAEMPIWVTSHCISGRVGIRKLESIITEENEDNEPDENTELLATGSMKMSLYAKYFKMGGGACLLLMLVLSLIIGQSASSGSDYWVTFWTNQEQLRKQYANMNTLEEQPMNVLAWNTTPFPGSENTKLYNSSDINVYNTLTNVSSVPLAGDNQDAMSPLCPPGDLACTSRRNYIPPVLFSTEVSLYIYSGCIAACVLLTLLRSIFFFKVCMNASIGLHDTMFRSILQGTMRFFDTNPSGRVLNRFSKDMGAIDELLPILMLEVIQIFLVMSGILTMVSIVNYMLIIPMLCVAPIYYKIRSIYLCTAQDIKRLEGVTRSPVFSHVSASFSGLTTIRASGAQEMLRKEFDSHQINVNYVPFPVRAVLCTAPFTFGRFTSAPAALPWYETLRVPHTNCSLATCLTCYPPSQVPKQRDHIPKQTVKLQPLITSAWLSPPRLECLSFVRHIFIVDFTVSVTQDKSLQTFCDLHTSAWYLTIATTIAFGFWLDCVSNVFVGCVTLSFLVFEDGILGADVGLAISQSLILSGMLQYGIRQTAEVVNQMTAVERVLEYTKIDKEQGINSESEKKVPVTWPSKGAIQFEHTSMSYSISDPPVLRDLNFVIEPAQKVGIVGRTGAGKSSLISALFRLAKLEGSIKIDQVDTQTVRLHDLRSRISIIPQEPVLFSASLRDNLDPFNNYQDDTLWNALEEVELKESVESLSHKVNAGGTNFSAGQRQLVCLARAIVRNSKVLVLDEATANVDPQTDTLIQGTIRRKFADCTVLTIAHRLNTIMDSDRVLVMDAGTMVEFGHPYELLQNQGGYFYSMVQETGKSTAEQLYQIAQQVGVLLQSLEVFEITEGTAVKSEDEPEQEVW
uniref:Uncharacterized protein n=1 Tax=Timema poppense TaxID=170557 RepID=A0A7R9CWY4_TIMPO|nr:unnamed protein product [Timema poppensis]